MKPLLAAAVLLMVGGMVDAHAQRVEPQGLPEPGAELVDDEFRVATREFGLDRRVEMYQWRLTEDGYERVWHDARIDSSDFAPGHENPPALPLENRRWWAQQPTLDGKPLDPAVLRALGQWRELHPNFSRLPANLAAAFQPEGSGLGSAENPLDPQTGDLRVSWRELVLPPLAGKVELRGGIWQLAPDAAAAPNTAPAPSLMLPRPLLLGAGLGMAVLTVIGAIAMLTRRRRDRGTR